MLDKQSVKRIEKARSGVSPFPPLGEGEGLLVYFHMQYLIVVDADTHMTALMCLVAIEIANR